MTPHSEPGAPEREGTASGLDEAQIDAADLRALHDAVKLRQLAPGVEVQCRALAGWEARLASALRLRAVSAPLAAPRSLRLRFAPLPRSVRVRRLSRALPNLRLRRGLRLALVQPVLRQRLRPDDLPEAQLKALLKALYEKCGAEARQLEIVAAFAHIPPEAVGSISVDPTLRAASFTMPDGLSAAEAQAGHYLAFLRNPAGETRMVLLRL
jgi:hypothetical protein